MIRTIARLSVRNSVAVNLATLAVCVGGLLLYLAMPREVFPEFSLGTVTVTTFWPGAAPEDVERLVTLPLEEELEGLDDLKEMSSVSQEGLSTITLQVESEGEVQELLDEVRAAVDRDIELPEDVEDPRVAEIKTEFPAIAVFIYGTVPEEQLRQIGERHKRALERIDGVSRVVLSGTREPRLWVEVDPLALERFGLSLQDVGLAVGARSRDAPLGSLSTGSGDFLLRVDAGVDGAAELRDLPVIARPDGTAVRLHQLARVRDTFARRNVRARFNGQPCLHLQVNKRASGDAIDISREVHAYIAAEQPRMPPGVAIGSNSDLSVYVRNRLDVMQRSATLGGLLVLLSLVLFLSLRVALFTALGIPVAFLGGLLVAGAIGISMNMMTMFALIVVLGMIVDDAIVVGENIYRLMEEGYSPVEAAIEGTAQVGTAVTATILTTVAAFLPVLMISGITGQFMRPLPLIVTFCLAASLFEALFVLPAHMAHWTGGQRRAAGQSGASPQRRWYEPGRVLYVRLLGLVLRWRYVTLALVLLATFAAGTYAAYRQPFSLFDDFESKVFFINMRAAADSSMEETERSALPVEQLMLDFPPEEVESVNMLTGVSYQDSTRFAVGQDLAQVWVELREDTRGRRPTAEIIEDLRSRLAVPPAGILSLDVDQPQAGPTGKAIDVAIRGPDLEVLTEICRRFERDLAGYPGIRDVRDNAQTGKREVRMRLRDEGRLLGFSEAHLSRELRAAFEGTRFGRLRRGRDDVEIQIKLPEELRSRRDVLEHLRVTAPGGARVPLGALAELYETSGPAQITRDDGERSIRVSADVNKREGNTKRITDDLARRYANLGEEFPGYDLEFKGDHQETAESMEGLRSSGLIAGLLIFLILGALFRSLSQPFVIMFAIPFSLIGMIAGHVIMGRDLSLMSLIGMIALAGVVVNDSLILVDFVNQRRAEGLALREALVTAGYQRFRPILLTSITTMLGLSPLTFFASGQARFLQPMAITIFFGLAASTFLILLVIPCAYAGLEDLRALVRRRS